MKLLLRRTRVLWEVDWALIFAAIKSFIEYLNVQECDATTDAI